jgi:outer membrane immunogenic protein
MKRMLLASIVMSTALSAWAVEDHSFYGGATWMRTTVDADVFGSLDLDTLGLVAGYQINRHVGIEGQFAFGVGDDTLAFQTEIGVVPMKVEIENYWSASFVGRLPLTDTIDLWAKGGYGSAKFKVSAFGFSESDTDSGFAWGLGAQMHFDRFMTRLGYERPTGDSDTDAFSLTLLYRF